ncbi:MAG: hypothetical protein IKI31_05250 [Treponema sp.]|nr:hypothetical protein [Treponema sp.]
MSSTSKTALVIICSLIIAVVIELVVLSRSDGKQSDKQVQPKESVEEEFVPQNANRI